jgi:hypothetical protein
LRGLFGKFGEISNVVVANNKRFAVLTFATTEAAAAALVMNKHEEKGQPQHLDENERGGVPG